MAQGINSLRSGETVQTKEAANGEIPCGGAFEPVDSLTPPLAICSSCGGLVREGVMLHNGKQVESGGLLHERIQACTLPAILQDEDWCLCHGHH